MGCFRRKREDGRRDGTYTIQFRDHCGRERRLASRIKNKRTAWDLHERIVELCEWRRAGLDPPAEIKTWLFELDARIYDKLAEFCIVDRRIKQTGDVAEAVERWVKELHALGRSAPYQRRVRTVMGEVIGLLSWKRVEDIETHDIQIYLGELRRRSLSSKTRENYLGVIKAFINWCVSSGLLRVEPSGMGRLEVGRITGEHRRQRRTLTDEEFQKLIEETYYGPIRGKYTGPRRALCYWVMSQTGLRIGEMRKLRVRDFNMKRRIIRIDQSITKNNKVGFIPILADDLYKALEWEFEPLEQWERPWPWGQNATPTLYFDLRRAGIEPQDEEGNWFDFHSLRGQFATNLARSNTPVSIATKLMRHADYRTTEKHYIKLREEDLRAATEAMRKVDWPGRGRTR